MDEKRSALEVWLQLLTSRSVLSPADNDNLLNLPGYISRVEKGRDFIRTDQRTGSVSLVVDGIVGRFCDSKKGDRRLSAIRVSGEMVNSAAAMCPTLYTAATALTPATLLHIPIEAVRTLFSTSTTLAAALWRECNVDIAIMERWLLRNAAKPAPERLAHVLCELTCRQRARCSGDEMPGIMLSQQTLGQIINLTSVHVNRTARNLRELNLIATKGGQLRITNFEALSRLAEFDPDYLQLDVNLRLDPRTSASCEKLQSGFRGGISAI